MMQRPLFRWLVIGLVVVLAGGGLWLLWPSDDRLVLTAEFDDVQDLVELAHVRVADVPVGRITDISLTDDNRALVEMEVERDTGLPSEVTANLRLTSLLGERYVELQPVEGAGGTLTSGHIDDTAVISGLEDLVATGNDLLGVFAAAELNRMVQAGATAFGGRGSIVGTTLEDFRAAVGSYRAGRDAIVDLIDAGDRLLGELAQDADLHADALADLNRAAAVLAEEDDRLLDTLEELAELSDVGERILRENGPSIDATIRRFRQISAQLTRIEDALANLLRWLPRHNLHVANGVLLEQSQVWNDFVVCGVHDEPDNPPNSCSPPNPGESNAPPPEYETDECDLEHEGCPYPEGVQPGGPKQQPGSGDGDDGGGG